MLDPIAHSLNQRNQDLRNVRSRFSNACVSNKKIRQQVRSIVANQKEMLTLKNMTRKSVREIELKRVDVLRQIKANKP